VAVLSWTDEEEDPLRIDLYCQNGGCEVREMTVIAIRAGGHELQRADVLALHTLEQGTPVERGEVHYDRRTSSGSDLARRMDAEERAGGPLANRTRPSSIAVSTHASWSDAHRAIFGEPLCDLDG
jgi:hypothetical protein